MKTASELVSIPNLIKKLNNQRAVVRVKRNAHMAAAANLKASEEQARGVIILVAERDGLNVTELLERAGLPVEVKS